MRAGMLTFLQVAEWRRDSQDHGEEGTAFVAADADSASASEAGSFHESSVFE